MYQTEINLYKQSLKSAWGYNDYNDWPIKFNSIMHMFIGEFAETFLDRFRIAEKNFSDAEIAQAFGNPSRIYRIIHSILCGMKRKKMSYEEQRRITGRLLELITKIKYGSPFNENGKNIILSDVSTIETLPVDQLETAQKIQKVCASLWAYTESITFRAHDVTKEIHGLYDYNGSRMLIRDYYHLHLTELWEGFPLLAEDTVRIVCVYQKDLKLNIDAYNHLFLKAGNFRQDMTAYQVFINGLPVALDYLYNQIPQINSCIKSITQWVNERDFREKTKKYAEIYWYRIKPLSDLMDSDWKLPPNVLENIKNGAMNERMMAGLSERDIKFLINTIL